MSNPSWPATLPSVPFQAGSGPQMQAQDNFIRTSMEAGPAKMRRRFTAVPVAVTFSLQLSEAQLSALDTFYDTTVKSVLPFDWTDPQTGLAATFRFTARPNRSWVAGEYWLVNFSLEKLP